MTITKYVPLWEDITSEEDEAGGSGKVEYSVFVYSDDPDNDTEASCRAYLKANAPTTYFDLVRTKIRVVEQMKRDDGEGIWRCIMTYEPPEFTQLPPVKPGDPSDPLRLSVKSSGQGTIKRKWSFNLIAETSETLADWYTFRGKEGLENGLGIKFDTPQNPDWVPEGVDYPLGVTQIIAEQAVPSSFVNGGYLLRVCEAANANYINADLWQGFAAGTLRFTEFDASENGAPSTAGDQQFWTFTFTFEFQRNIPIAEINAQLAKLVPPLLPFDDQQIPLVKGHWHLEINSEQDEIPVDQTTTPPKTKIVEYPVRCAVHSLYPETSFTTLFNYGIPWP